MKTYLVRGQLLVLGLVLLSCTKKNPSLCCVDEADCNAVGLSEVKLCEAGLACVENQCILQSCETDSCSAATPLCNASTNVCEGCTDSSACMRFPDADVCDTATGGCVDCVAPADCPADRPVCDANACRVCKLDSDCSSGACGDDGACVAESAIVYLDPGGTDSGTCTRSAPCRTVAFGASKTTATRDHIVMAPGGYTEEVVITPQNTFAARLYIHGGGAGLSLPATAVESAVLTMRLPATIRDLEIQSLDGSASLQLEADSYLLERLKIRRGYVGIAVYSSATIRNVHIENATDGIVANTGAHLDIDGMTIVGTGRLGGISARSSTVQISNVLIYGTMALGLDLTGANGTVSFVTVADSGSDSGTGPRAVACGPAITIRSSIIWAPGTVPRAPVAGCNLISTIAGPTTVAGAMNVDPWFVNAAARDYHLAPNSPARDAVETGPALDFEGDARPRGARFDIGADEAAP